MYKLVLISLLLNLVLGCSEAKQDSTEDKPGPLNSEVKGNDNRENAVKFWQLITQQKVDEAIQLANSLDDGDFGKAAGFYLDLFKKGGVKESILNRKDFNKVDAFFWTQAQYFKSLTNDALLGKSEEDQIEVLYKLVVEKIKSQSETKDVGSYPFHIWQRGFGAADRQCWVLCELAYQIGARTSVIYLKDPKTQLSPLTICELVYKNRHYIIDIQNRKFLPDTKITDLTAEKIKEVWKEKPELHNTFENYTRFIPSMPIDYADRNQRLTVILGDLIRFGEPPQNRFYFWKEIYPQEETRFWGYAIKVLKDFELYNEEK